MKVSELKQAIEDAKRFVTEAERVLEENEKTKGPGYYEYAHKNGLVASTTSTTTGIIKAQSLVLSQSLVRIRK